MLVLLLKQEKPNGLLSLGFVGAYDSVASAQKHVDPAYGTLEKDERFGNRRMLEACGSTPPKEVWTTKILGESPRASCFLLVQW